MIYFVQGVTTRRIKIGISDDPLRRLVQLQDVCPDELVLLGVMAGDRSEEEALHERFDAARFRMEWFEPIQELLDFIAENAQPLSVPKRPLAIALVRQDLSGPASSVCLRRDGVYRLGRCVESSSRGRLRGNTAAVFDYIDQSAGDHAYCVKTNRQIANAMGLTTEAVKSAVATLETTLDSGPWLARVLLEKGSGWDHLGTVLWKRSGLGLPNACSADSLFNAISAMIAYRHRLKANNPLHWISTNDGSLVN